MTLIEFLAYLGTLRRDPDGAAVLDVVRPSIDVQRATQRYRDAVGALIAAPIDGAWPLAYRERGMGLGELYETFELIDHEMMRHAAPWARDTLCAYHHATPNGAIVELLHCTERCIHAALDNAARLAAIETCRGERLRVYSMHGWLTRPERWVKIVGKCSFAKVYGMR